MEKVLVSACLLGQRVRYDGRDARAIDPRLERLEREGRIVQVCPEVSGGLPVPRPAAELRGLRIVTAAGDDVTANFHEGARVALELARRHGIRVAILKDRSPSCGSREVYDGSFSGTRRQGEGVTTACLRAHGIRVFGEDEIDEALRLVSL